MYKSPEKVVIVANDGTASAAEMLIIMAKQNAKTLVAGANTSGGSDFLEPQFQYLCNRDYLIGIPWIKRTRLEYKYDIDGIGIPPDLKIDTYANDWIRQLLQQMKHHKGKMK